MLDYAVNGVVYWPLEQLCELFVRQCQRDGREPEAAVRGVAGEEVGVEEFWQRVGDSLRAGKVRMVFVSDQIPPELRRVVEFLNGQMSPAEVLAIAVKQYVGTDGARTLVPRVIGQTAEVEARKGRRPSGERRRWDAESIFASIREKCGEREARAARELYEWTCSAVGGQPWHWWALVHSVDRGSPCWRRLAESTIRSPCPVQLWTDRGAIPASEGAASVRRRTNQDRADAPPQRNPWRVLWTGCHHQAAVDPAQPAGKQLCRVRAAQACVGVGRRAGEGDGGTDDRGVSAAAGAGGRGGAVLGGPTGHLLERVVEVEPNGPLGQPLRLPAPIGVRSSSRAPPATPPPARRRAAGGRCSGGRPRGWRRASAEAGGGPAPRSPRGAR